MTTRRAFQFRDHALRIAPPWLRSGNGARVLYTLGATLDSAQDWLWQGIQARMPLVATPTALSAIGRDRRITRGYAETDAAYAGRLAGYLQAWARAGTARGIMDQVAGYLAPASVDLRIVTNSGMWYARAADGTFTWEAHTTPSNWDWDGDTASWFRFWLIIYSPWAAEDTWGSGTWGDGGAWGTTADPGYVSAIRGIVGTWKAAHAKCEWIIEAFNPATFDPSAPEPDGTWGTWSDSDPRVPTRLATARYWSGIS